MDLAQSVEQWLRYVEPAVLLLLLLRLAAERLLGTYRAFSIYLAFLLLQDAIPLMLGFGLSGNAYARWFFFSEPITWVLSYLVLVELFNLTLANFPGVRSAGKWLFGAGLIVAILAAAGSSLPSVLTRSRGLDIISIYSIIERSAMIVTLVMLAALQFLIVHYRLQLPRNTIVYSFTYAVYFSARAVQSFLIGELGPGFTSAANGAAMLIDAACLLLLACALSRKGDRVDSVRARRLTSRDREQLRDQLRGLNDVLVRLRQFR
jgi:hypothetical protein